jgi:predicted ester cyclase
VRGRDALLPYYTNLFRAVPDLGFKTVSIHCCGDTIISEFIFSGTFTGPMATPEGEIAPTGKSFKIRSAAFFKITPDGLIAEDRTYYDTLDHMKQMGLIN